MICCHICLSYYSRDTTQCNTYIQLIIPLNLESKALHLFLLFIIRLVSKYHFVLCDCTHLPQFRIYSVLYVTPTSWLYHHLQSMFTISTCQYIICVLFSCLHISFRCQATPIYKYCISCTVLILLSLHSPEYTLT